MQTKYLIDYKQLFIDIALNSGALKFGSFKLKSGRISPYFFNAGEFYWGEVLKKLGFCYAAALKRSNLKFDMLFGPAYKGIPLVSSMAVALFDNYKIDIPYCFNRKEEKQHGEAGLIVGAPISGEVVIIDDVITAGTAVKESLDIITKSGGKVTAIIVGLDRKERGASEMSATQEIERDYSIPVVSIIDIDDIIRFVTNEKMPSKILKDISVYRDQFGVA